MAPSDKTFAISFGTFKDCFDFHSCNRVIVAVRPYTYSCSWADCFPFLARNFVNSAVTNGEIESWSSATYRGGICGPETSRKQINAAHSHG